MASAVVAAPLITEFQAINGSLLESEPGEFPDWIEIHNPDAAPVDLGGWSLTDDPGELGRWRFPVGATLAPGGYLLVFASGESRDGADEAGRFHAGFQLSGDGEFLALVDPSGTIVDSFAPSFPPQRASASYGHEGWFARPTPGAPNGAAAAGFADPVTCSAPRGVYHRPFDCTLATETPGARIVFTTDGSEPTPLTGRVFDGPVEITRTTVLRARAIAPGRVPSEVTTVTFLFPEDAARGSDMDPRIFSEEAYRDLVSRGLVSLPVMSLAVDDGAFFGLDGIYTDFTLSGKEAEVPVSVEWFGPATGDGPAPAAGFQIDGGIRIHGGQARQHAKKPMRLYFRSEYGADRLRFPLFPGSTVQSFKRLVLRGGGHDAWTSDWGFGRNDLTDSASYLRDEFIRRTEIELGRLSPRGRFVNLFINGRFWGLYDLHERADEFFFSDHLGGEPDDWDVIKPEPFAAAGDRVAWENLRTLVRAAPTPENFAAAGEYLDFDALIDSLVVRMWSGDHDWLAPVYQSIGGRDFVVTDTNNRNWFAGRQSRGGVPEPFHFFAWDAEISMGNDRFTFNGNRENGYNLTRINTPDSPGELYDRLRRYEEFRLRLADRLEVIIGDGGVLSTERNRARFERLEAEVEEALVGESARWGGIHEGTPPLRRDTDWREEVEWLKESFLDVRGELLRGMFERSNLLPDLEAPVIAPPGGLVASGTEVVIEDPGDGAGTLWFTTDGSDPRRAGGVTLQTLLPEFAPVEVLVPSAANGGDRLASADWTGVAPPPNAAAWRTGEGGLGFEREPEAFADLIRFHVGEMDGTATSVYARFPFRIEDPALLEDVGRLLLRIKFDDGFVAYLNGTEIARDNAPADPRWDSTSVGGVTDEAATSFLTLDVTDDLDLLVVGDNVLAIHGLNSDVESSDLLVSPRLDRFGVVVDSGVADSAVAFEGVPLVLTESTILRARVQGADGSWSALKEARFFVDAEPAGPGTLVISEIHYRPLGPSTAEELAAAGSRGAFEFVELRHVGDRPVDLEGVRLVDGVTFTFPSRILAPGGHVVVVRDAAAFAARYGAAAVASVAGTFENQTGLANGGETVSVVDSAGWPIDSITYGDAAPWPESPDGGGPSLELAGDALDGAPRDNPRHWRASWRVHGSPGADPEDAGGDLDGDGLPDAWELAFLRGLESGAADDPDGDGLDNATERALGSDPGEEDTDGDGLPDGVEAVGGSSDPLLTDTDADGLTDRVESLVLGTDPRRRDSDLDGLEDGVETGGLDPLDPDSDDDGFSDGRERLAGTDPLDGGDRPRPAGDTLVVDAPMDGEDVDPPTVRNRAAAADGIITGIDDERLAADPEGVVGGALAFGLDDEEAAWVDFGPRGDPASGSLSVSFWLKADEVDGTRRVLDKGEGGPSGTGWGVTLEDGRLVAAGSTPALPGERVGKSRPLAAGEWHHVVVVIDSDLGRWRCYLDGRADGWDTLDRDAFAPGSSFASPAPLRLGGSPDDLFIGRIDDLAVWRFPLDDAQASRIFEAAAAGRRAARAFEAIVPDEDGDGLPDAWELAVFGSLDRDGAADLDGDGLTDGEEFRLESDPTRDDTDGDGVDDGAELAAGRDPLMAEDEPAPVRLDEGLVIHAPFDASQRTGLRPGSTAFDTSSPPHNGRLQGTFESVPGVRAEALAAVAAGVSFRGAGAEAAAGRSVAFWFLAGATPPGGARVLASGFDGSRVGWAILLDGDHLMALGESEAGREWWVSGSDVPADGTRWTHVALVVDREGSRARLFVDGVESTVQAGGADLFAGDPLPDGGGVGLFRLDPTREGSGDFIGAIDEFAMWSRALSAAEIAAVERSGRTGRGLPMNIPANPDLERTFAFSPEPVAITLNPGETGEVVVDIGNGGAGALNYLYEVEIENAETLEDVRASLGSQLRTIANLVPDRFNFSEGLTGEFIEDGGLDMFDVGNLLSTSLGGPIAYSNNRIVEDVPALGGGRYFTLKSTGLFVFAADLEGVGAFRIDGDLGADGIGSVDGAVLEAERGTRRFRGFVKRVWDGEDPVFGGIDPSVNHLVIVEDDGSLEASQTFPTDTNSDAHEVAGLERVRRLYYLLFASRDGRRVTDEEVQAIFEGLLDGIGVRPGWLMVPDQREGQIAGAGEQQAVLGFDAGAFEAGSYEARLRIRTNDPLVPSRVVGIEMRVNGPPTAGTIANVTVPEDTPEVRIDLFEAFEDVEDGDDQLTYEFRETVDSGLFEDLSFDSETGELVLVPVADASGTAGFFVRATDRNGLSAEASFIVAILPVNDPPRLVSDAPVVVSVEEDSSAAVVSLRGRFEDVDDPVEALEYRLVEAAPDGLLASVEVDSDAGTLTFVPAADAFGDAVIVVEAVDPEPSAGRLAIEVVVAPVNDPPVQTRSVILSGDEDAGPLEIDVSTVVADVDDSFDDLRVRVANAAPAEGLVAGAGLGADGRTLVVTLVPDAFGAGSVDLEVIDPDGLSATVVVGLDVAPVNDAPRPGHPFVWEVAEDFAVAGFAVEPVLADVDDAFASLVIEVVSVDPPGLLADVAFDPASGRVAATSVADRNGEGTLVLRARDPDGVEGTAVVPFAIAPVNDPPRPASIPPVIADAAASDVVLDAAGFFSDPDLPEGDRLAFSVVENTKPGIFRSVGIDAQSGRLTLRFEPSATGVATLVLRATDAAGTSADNPVQVSLPVIPVPGLDDDPAWRLNRQTGLFDRVVAVRNDSARPMAGFELVISNVPEGMRIWNATADLGGGTWLIRIDDRPLAAGASTTVTVSLYARHRVPPDGITMTSRVVYAETPDRVSGSLPVPDPGIAARPRVTAINRLPDGRLELSFTTRPGRVYHVEYSADLRTWHRIDESVPMPAGQLGEMTWTGEPPAAPNDRQAVFFRIRERGEAP